MVETWWGGRMVHGGHDEHGADGGHGIAGASGSEGVDRERPIRWGILATGGIAATFTEALLTLPDAEVAAVGSRSIGSAKTFADRYGIERAYGSWAELAQDDSLDVVYVATPHSAHRAAAGLCLEAGRAVLCEKAFTINAREAAELTTLAAERGSFLMEAMWMYCNPLILRMRELVRDGVIGEIRSIQADFGIAGPFGADHRLRDPAQAGGALLDLGVYPVSFAQLLLGEPDTILATAHLTPEGVDDNTGIILGWDSGALALLSCSITADTPVTASVTGTTGRIEIPHGYFHPESFTLHRDGHEPREYLLSEVTDVPRRDGMRHEAAEVMRCLRAGETQSALVPLSGTLAIMRTLDTVREQIGVRYPGE